MKESKLNRDCVDFILKKCQEITAPPPVYYKIADAFTKGIPDSVLNWNERTSWLEFKLLGPNESIHDQLDKHQLVELIKLERTSHRAWVVAFRKANVAKRILPQTIIYRPRKLWHEQVPQPVESVMPVLRQLLEYGVAQGPGFNHQMVWELIHDTHIWQGVSR